MSERDLDALTLRLRGRLERESAMTERMKEAVKRYEDQVEWSMRIEDDAAAAEGDGEGEDEDDLFGDEDGEKPPPTTKVAPVKIAPNPREGWNLTDYLKFMDTGVQPAHAATTAAAPTAPSRQTADVIDLT